MPKLPDASATLALLDQVRAIYRELAERPLERNCTGIAQCCHFALTGKTPYLTRGEAMLAAKAWRASGRKTIPPQQVDGACPFLKNHRCQIYDSRPFGCRTHFCDAAGGPAARNQVRDLIQRLEDIDRSLGGNGAINLPTAVQAWI
ncbi:MAG: hypothetical protein RL117_889 [Verrucomicrobiota bacterium]